jgi:hypothetical protein
MTIADWCLLCELSTILFAVPVSLPWARADASLVGEVGSIAYKLSSPFSVLMWFT